ncbi:MAG: hypothetical protein MHMPM18_004256, partial [Marteilia pararefringens]
NLEQSIYMTVYTRHTKRRRKCKSESEGTILETSPKEKLKHHFDTCKKIVDNTWRAFQLFIILTMIIASVILTTKEYFEKSKNFAILSKCAKQSFYDPVSRKCIRDHLFSYNLIYMYYNVVDIGQFATSFKNYIESRLAIIYSQYK